MTAGQGKKAAEWVQRAKAFYNSTGKSIALAEFNNPRGQFVQKQQYIFVLDLDGNMLAHGMNHFFAGNNFTGVKDSNGKEFIREIVETAKTKGTGWTDYIWFDPISKKELPKSLYFEKIDDLIICCGTYRETPDPSELELL
jgi:cytochrome c